MKHWRTALVTGASSGIGEALARRLAKEGVLVVLCARREEASTRVAREIDGAGGRARAERVDVSDGDATAKAIRRIDEEVGGLDLVVANAGIGGTPRVEELTWESAAPVLRTNFDGAIATLLAVLPRMLERKRGHLVGVSSIAGYAPLPRSAAYGATKAGLSMFLESLRIDLLGRGVAATVVNPGFVRTPLSDRNRFPMPFIVPAEVAADLVVRRLPGKPAVIDFPLPLVAALRASRLVPRPLLDLAMRRHGVIGL